MHKSEYGSCSKRGECCKEAKDKYNGRGLNALFAMVAAVITNPIAARRLSLGDKAIRAH